MRSQDRRRDSKTVLVVGEDCGIPTSLFDEYQHLGHCGPLYHSDPRSPLLSMSQFDKAHEYALYDYHDATRSGNAQAYSNFAPPSYSANYEIPPPQLPSGLPHAAAAAFQSIHSSHPHDTHGPVYYAPPYPPQHAQYPSYADLSPRPLPEVTSYGPTQGRRGTSVTVWFRSAYDFDLPQVTPVIMFGRERCQSVITKTTAQGSFEYSLSANAPAMVLTNMTSSTFPLSLTFEDDNIVWQSPSLEFGSFTYLDPPTTSAVEASQATTKKRKVSPDASPRRSPTKKPSLRHLKGSGNVDSAAPPMPLRRPTLPDLPHTRRFDSAELPPSYPSNLHRAQSQQALGGAQGTPSLQASYSPSWSYVPDSLSAQRRPSGVLTSGTSRASILPSPASGSTPSLIRTSTLQHSPSTADTETSVAQSFNPYATYGANSKAMLQISGDLNTMNDKWTPTEREAGRRLVQFQRSQSGSTITATFEPVTLEERIPKSICVSCIYWEEKDDYYVTSVDTISLLESLVAVRFTVEEKNRIRRNLEGFHPATVSKTKAESEEFFKLIMGFPNPKPRNIEKDVKVFPWRILPTALKKIIGKYSASYSSTAGALHTAVASGPSYPPPRAPENGSQQQARVGASPHSTPTSASSHIHAYPPSNYNHYLPHTTSASGLGIMPSAGAPPHLHLSVPGSAHRPGSNGQTPAWHQPVANYSNDVSAMRGHWEFPGNYLTTPPTSGIPNAAHMYPHEPRFQSMPAYGPASETSRFGSFHAYEQHSHPASNA